ncbi:hypothetical protein RB595_006774 [Gaeumannomyces hyphopodioides]
MSSQDYYSGASKSLPNPNPSRTPDPYQSSSPAPYAPSNPPAYSSQPYLGLDDPRTAAAGSSSSSTSRPPAGGPSPFDTVFDDYVYPMNGQQNQTPTPGGDPYASSNAGRQQQDTTYYGGGSAGPGGVSRMNSDDRMASADDIPLQDRQRQKDVEANDHVYDSNGAPPGVAAAGSGSRRQRPDQKKIRFGELGMLGSGKKKIAWVCYIFSVIQGAVFIGEIVKNTQLTGSPIMIKPQFNPMIGPSTWVLINMGARYVVCMHHVDKVVNAAKQIQWPCPNTTTTDSNCSLGELCGFGGVAEPPYGKFANVSLTNIPTEVPAPNQWFRFITPIFMHAGLIHIGFNLLLQLTIGRDMEMSIGTLRFFLVYMSAGIFGFVMGGNFAATGIASTGASGSLFGVIALTLLDLLYSWKDRKNPTKDLLFIFLDVAISFVLGLLPGLDNFSHIGGFLMGLALGVCLLHSPNSLRRRIGTDDPPYTPVQGGRARVSGSQTAPPFFKNPVGFFKGRKPLWWVWWLIRAGALLLVFVAFVLLLNNFYVTRVHCEWCKYLSCLNINGWCDIGNLQIVDDPPKTTSTPSPQLLLRSMATNLY